ncbi:COP1-interacting protein-like protein [Actinidia rufa]|uniref:COP1-interacting protein-like protein n=1 Tax=Actinidia rufa TaxID=165716 RepID=A0A7J0EG35_9ERIC|nr:COP1-interacting protein-like protein [Actinidia rufa]
MMEGKSKIDTYGGHAVAKRASTKLVARQCLNCSTKTMRLAAGAVSGKRLSDGQCGACLDALAVPSLDRLQPDVCLDAPALVSKNLRHASHLMSPNTPWDCHRPLPLDRASNAVIVPSLLSIDNSEVTMSLAQLMALFDGVCTEFRHRRPPNLLYSDNSAGVPALARLDSVISVSTLEYCSLGPPPAPRAHLVQMYGRAIATCSRPMSCERRLLTCDSTRPLSHVLVYFPHLHLPYLASVCPPSSITVHRAFKKYSGKKKSVPLLPSDRLSNHHSGGSGSRPLGISSLIGADSVFSASSSESESDITFVRFVSTPEILERVYTLESEILQIDEAIAIQGNNDMGLSTVEDYQVKPVRTSEGIKPMTDANEEKAIVLYQPDAHPPEANGSSTKEGNSKVQLLKVLETRKTMLQKEQGMAFARAVAAGFNIDHMAPLLSFAECFGASRLMDACLRFIDLWKRKHETGQWLEIEAAEATPSQSDFSVMNAPGIMLSNVANKRNESHGDLVLEDNGKTGIDASAEEKRPMDHQVPVGQQEYFQGQFPHPMFPYWPVHSPPGTLPVFQPYPVQGMPYYQGYPGNGPFYQPPYPPPENTRFDVGYTTGQKRHSMDSRDSNTESEAWQMDATRTRSQVDLESEKEASETRGARKKAGRSGKKQSGVVVIRNLNYISKGQNSSGSESQSASDSETDKKPGDLTGSGPDMMHKNSLSSKRKGSHAKSMNESTSLDKEETNYGKEADGGHWQAFQNFLLRDTDERNHASDQGMFASEKNVQIKRQQSTVGDDPLAIDGRDSIEMHNGRTTEFQQASGNVTKMLRASNDEGLISRGKGHYGDGTGGQMDVQFTEINGRKVVYRRNANDDFMIAGRESQSPFMSSSDPLAVNGFMHTTNNLGESSMQDITDESFIVPFRSMSLDQVECNDRTAIGMDSELPSTVQKREKRNKEVLPDVKQGPKKSDKDRKSKVTLDSLDKKKNVGPIRKGKPSKLSPLDDAKARAERLRTFKAELQKQKKEKHFWHLQVAFYISCYLCYRNEEDRKRLEALKMERQKRIAARGGSTIAKSPSSQESKKQLTAKLPLNSVRASKFSDSEPGSSSPLQRSKIRTASLGSNESQKASKISKSSNSSHMSENRLTRSVSSLPDPRKETTDATPGSKPSLARIRRLSEPKTVSNAYVTPVKTRGAELAPKPKVSNEPESKKISSIINLDRSKAETLPGLKLRTSQGSLDIGKNKSAPKQMTQKVNGNKSFVTSGSNELNRDNDKDMHQSDVDDNPVIDKTVVMLECEKSSFPPVHSSAEIIGLQKEYYGNQAKVKKIEMIPEYATIHAPASPMDRVDIEPVQSQLLEQPKFQEVTYHTEKEQQNSSRPYQAPHARVSSLEDPCCEKSEYGKAPSMNLETVTMGVETVKAAVSGLENLKLAKITEAPEKSQVKESSKGFRRLLKFGKKNDNSAAGDHSVVSDNASGNSEVDGHATNAASSSEVHTLKNLISQDETPTPEATSRKCMASAPCLFRGVLFHQLNPSSLSSLFDMQPNGNVTKVQWSKRLNVVACTRQLHLPF